MAVNDLTLIATAGAVLAGLAIAMAALLRGWRGWLELKRAELECEAIPGGGAPSPQARIELAALKERVRRLEAIANGVEG